MIAIRGESRIAAILAVNNASIGRLGLFFISFKVAGAAILHLRQIRAAYAGLSVVWQDKVDAHKYLGHIECICPYPAAMDKGDMTIAITRISRKEKNLHALLTA